MTGTPEHGKRQVGWIVAGLIVFAFVAVVVAKQGSGASVEPSATAQPSATAEGPSTSRADASAAYAAARKTGKPIYLLFHSLTCVPCIEISAVVDEVVPAYDGKVVFVNAISEDDGSKRLAEGFKFQYIPTSFFIDSAGTVQESFTGAMDAASMRTRLDKLTAR